MYDDWGGADKYTYSLYNRLETLIYEECLTSALSLICGNTCLTCCETHAI